MVLRTPREPDAPTTRATPPPPFPVAALALIVSLMRVRSPAPEAATAPPLPVAELPTKVLLRICDPVPPPLVPVPWKAIAPPSAGVGLGSFGARWAPAALLTNVLLWT